MANKQAFADHLLTTPGSMTAQTPDAAGHTPGPWTVVAGANCYSFDGRIVAGGKCIAFVDGDEWQDDEGDYHIVPSADARLIAAAPELLEALEDAVAEISELREWVDRHVPHGLIACEDWAKLHRPLVTQTVLRNARAALTKARGPQ